MGCLEADTGEDLGPSGQTQGLSPHRLDTKQMTSEMEPGTEMEKLEPLLTPESVRRYRCRVNDS